MGQHPSGRVFRNFGLSFLHQDDVFQLSLLGDEECVPISRFQVDFEVFDIFTEIPFYLSGKLIQAVLHFRCCQVPGLNPYRAVDMISAYVTRFLRRLSMLLM